MQKLEQAGIMVSPKDVNKHAKMKMDMFVEKLPNPVALFHVMKKDGGN